jgi:hypothetical protein
VPPDSTSTPGPDRPQRPTAEVGARTATGTRTVDGRRLFGKAVGFGRALRRGGLGVDLGAAIDFARSLEIVDIGDREQVRAAGEAVFVRRKDDLDPYHAIFDRYWRGRLELGSEALFDDTWTELVPADEQRGDEPQLAGDDPSRARTARACRCRATRRRPPRRASPTR